MKTNIINTCIAATLIGLASVSAQATTRQKKSVSVFVNEVVD